MRFSADLEERFGQVIREEFGIEPSALTADEAVYLFGFRSADGLRASIAAARRRRDERLRAKGVRPPEAEDLDDSPDSIDNLMPTICCRRRRAGTT